MKGGATRETRAPGAEGELRIVTFVPLGRSAEAKTDETILDAARRAGAPLGNSCGGTGICGRCRVSMIDGADNVSPPTALEQRARLGANERLACQAVVNGPCSVTTTYW